MHTDKTIWYQILNNEEFNSNGNSIRYVGLKLRKNSVNEIPLQMFRLAASCDTKLKDIHFEGAWDCKGRFGKLNQIAIFEEIKYTKLRCPKWEDYMDEEEGNDNAARIHLEKVLLKKYKDRLIGFLVYREGKNWKQIICLTSKTTIK